MCDSGSRVSSRTRTLEDIANKGFSPIAIGRLPGQRRLWIGISSIELEYWGDCGGEANQVDGPPQDRIACHHGIKFTQSFIQKSLLI